MNNIFIENDNFTVTNVAYCYYKKVSKNFTFKTEKRPFHGLLIVLSGELIFNFYNNEYVLQKGDVLIQQKDDRYSLSISSENAEYIVVSFECDSADVISDICNQSKVFRTEHNMRYIDAFNRAADIFFYSGVYTKPLIRAMIQEIICNIIRYNDTHFDSRIKSPANAAKHYIDEYSYKFISLDDISHAAGCSASHLRKLFKASYGESPNKYLNRVRIDRAKEMLSTGMFSLEEAALASGFRNVYYFSRVFKEFTGISPGKY